MTPHTADSSVSSTIRSAQIKIYPDGPMLVRGEVQIVNSDGTALPRRRRTIALCRCGSSGLMPLCDGTHKLVGKAGRHRAGQQARPIVDED